MESSDERRRRRKKKVLEKIFTPPPHAHTADFGSELRCPLCNPYCWKNHQKPGNYLVQFCGDPDCPLKPKSKEEIWEVLHGEEERED